MPENSPPSVENDIAELERMLAEKKATLELRKVQGMLQEMPHDKEILREAVKEKLSATSRVQTQPKTDQPQPLLPPSQSQSAPASSSVASYDLDELKPKVQELIDMAFKQSLEQAIAAVKATENPALIDAFHDVLTDELYDYLVEAGKLSKI